MRVLRVHRYFTYCSINLKPLRASKNLDISITTLPRVTAACRGRVNHFFKYRLLDFQTKESIS